MKTLSGLDATFLYLETPQTPMHVGSLHLYELPKGFRGSFHRAVQDHIAARLHLAPIFTRRLAFMPLGLGHPAWVEAGEVDLDFHIRKAPGAKFTVRQVETAAGKLHAELMDRERPLWQFTIFENVLPPKGMAAGSRLVAFHSKIHHAALDGKGGTVLANAILDLTPVPREVAPADPSRRRRGGGDPRIGEMVGAVFSNSLAQYAKLARALPAAAGSIGSLARQSIARTKAPVQLAPKTLFNAGITARRSFATATLPFAQARAVARAAGGSFNDVVLWVCATALRDYLQAHGTVPRKPLVAAMPVSLREDSNRELNNQASLSLVQLGTHLADPRARMQAILASTGKVKEALSELKSVLPTDYPSLLAPWLVGGAGRLALKTYGSAGIAERLPAIANVAISNVPGPQVPLYLAGARMLTFHPLSIILHGMALNITIQTYAGRVDFGLVADPVAVTRLQQLAAGLESAFAQAVQVFGTEAPATPQPESARAAPRKRPVKARAPRRPPAKPPRRRAA